MTHETGPEMDEAFARRMRRGLVAMPPREVARTRRIRRTAATGAAGVLALAIVSVLGVQTLGAGQGGVEAVPTPTPTAVETPSPEPSAEPTSTPSPSPQPTEDPAPTPPPGFEGVAAGVPIVTETFTPMGPIGDAGAAHEPGTVFHDIYVLCRGSGLVDIPGQFDVDCATLAPSTVIATLRVATWPSEGTRPSVVFSDDFDGTVRIVPAGVTPGGIGVGGTATVWVQCGVESVGGVAFACTDDGTTYVTELAAWGIPYGADALVPAIAVSDETSWTQVRLQLQPDP